MNQAERWFALITQCQIRRGSFISTKALVVKIEAFIAAYNAGARPFQWTAITKRSSPSSGGERLKAVRQSTVALLLRCSTSKAGSPPNDLRPPPHEAVRGQLHCFSPLSSPRSMSLNH